MERGEITALSQSWKHKGSATLTVFGNNHSDRHHCDGIHRRDVLTIGGSVLGGLALADILRAESGVLICGTGPQ